jgi:hypothetical protein
VAIRGENVEICSFRKEREFDRKFKKYLLDKLSDVEVCNRELYCPS